MQCCTTACTHTSARTFSCQSARVKSSCASDFLDPLFLPTCACEVIQRVRLSRPSHAAVYRRHGGVALRRGLGRAAPRGRGSVAAGSGHCSDCRVLGVRAAPATNSVRVPDRRQPGDDSRVAVSRRRVCQDRIAGLSVPALRALAAVPAPGHCRAGAAEHGRPALRLCQQRRRGQPVERAAGLRRAGRGNNRRYYLRGLRASDGLLRGPRVRARVHQGRARGRGGAVRGQGRLRILVVGRGARRRALRGRAPGCAGHVLQQGRADVYVLELDSA